jgi:bile acid:Na+ symporter, BASS family
VTAGWPRFAQDDSRSVTEMPIAATELCGRWSFGAIAGGRTTLSDNVGVLTVAVVSICAVSLTVGYLLPRWMHLAPRQAIAISLEIGLHNAVLAIGMAMSPQLLNSAEMATPAALYGAVAPFIALAFVVTARRLDPAFRDVSRSGAAHENESPG